MARKKLVRSPFRLLASPGVNAREQDSPIATRKEKEQAEKKMSLDQSSERDSDGGESFGATGHTSQVDYEPHIDAQARGQGQHSSNDLDDQPLRNRGAFANGIQTPPLVRRAMTGLGSSNKEVQDSDDEIDLEAGKEKGDNKGAAVRRLPAPDHEENGVYSWTDAELAERYNFEKEIGFGNWGSCWLVRSRTERIAVARDKPYAVKLVHRQGTAPSNARVKALWNEYKVLRACGKPVHPNLVQFKEFAITPSYALVIMDHYRQAMNVALPESLYAGPGGYFHQLLSSVAWLHDRYVTHCDIKVANLLVDMSRDKISGNPILVDFGFATLHDEKSRFISSQTWGTPEYLSPERSRGDRHDERLSDMWALGVTFFEIATGRTPFEHEEEQFLTKEQLDVYYKRTLVPDWVGEWSISPSLEKLCKSMLAPDPADRTYASDAMQHRFFRTVIPNGTQEEDKVLNHKSFQIVDETNAVHKAHTRKNILDGSLSARKKPELLSLDFEEHSIGTGDNTVCSVIGDESLSNLQQQTPPALPRKDCRREQIQIIVDETDDDSSNNRSSLSFKKSSSIQHTPLVGSESNLASNAKMVERKKFHLFKHSSSSLDSGSTAKPPATIKGDVRGIRNSPYPPSTSQKLKSLRPATSSSERRHSPQTQDLRRPATHHGEEAPYVASQGDPTAVLTMRTLSGRFARGSLEVSTKKVKLDNSAKSQKGSNNDENVKVPMLEYLQSTRVSSTPSSSNRKSPTTSPHTMDVNEHFKEATAWFRTSNATSPTLSEVKAHELEERLEEMDRLAARLVKMVRETRMALHEVREVKAKESTFGGITPPHHKAQNSQSTYEEEEGTEVCESKTMAPLQPPESTPAQSLQLRDADYYNVSPKGTLCGLVGREECEDVQRRQSRDLLEQVCSQMLVAGQSHTNDQSGSICKDDIRLRQADVVVPRAQSKTSEPQMMVVAKSSTLSSSFKIRRGLTVKLSRSVNEKFSQNDSSPPPADGRSSGGNVLQASFPQKSPLLKTVAAEAMAEKENLSSWASARTTTHTPAAISTSPGALKEIALGSQSAVMTPVRKEKVSDGAKRIFLLSRSNSITAEGRRRNKIIPIATQSLSSRRRTTITDISDIDEPEWNLAHSPTSSLCVPLTPLRPSHAGVRQLTTPETWTQARHGRRPAGQSSPELANFTSKVYSAGGTISGTSSASTTATSIGCDPPRSLRTVKKGVGHASQTEHHGHAHSISSGTSGALWRMLTNRVTANRNARHVGADRW